MASRPGWVIADDWEPACRRSDWWCGCALVTDLANELGFLRAADPRDHDKALVPLWVGPEGSLPHQVSHVIVADNDRGQGTVCEVRREAGRVELWRAPTASDWLIADDGERSPFLAELRHQALDLLLTVLENRFR